MHWGRERPLLCVKTCFAPGWRSLTPIHRPRSCSLPSFGPSVGRHSSPLAAAPDVPAVVSFISRGRDERFVWESSNRPKITGHRSRELERYQHLTPELRALTVNLIATELFRAKRARKESENGTPTGTLRGRRVTENSNASQRLARRRVNGGVDGARTRDLRRDRPAF